MKRFLKVFIGASTFLFGVAIVAGTVVWQAEFDRRGDEQIRHLNSVVNLPRFSHLGGGEYREEVGNIHVNHYTERNAGETIETNCREPKVIVLERGDQLDAAGQPIGKRCILLVWGEPRLFLAEGENVWIIDAPNVELLKEFENSSFFLDWKTKETKVSQ
jgi:hypothetical protein